MDIVSKHRCGSVTTGSSFSGKTLCKSGGVRVNTEEPVSYLKCKDYEKLWLLFCMGLKPGWCLSSYGKGTN
jgi:hypothetical protein